MEIIQVRIILLMVTIALASGCYFFNDDTYRHQQEIFSDNTIPIAKVSEFLFGCYGSSSIGITIHHPESYKGENIGFVSAWIYDENRSPLDNDIFYTYLARDEQNGLSYLCINSDYLHRLKVFVAYGGGNFCRSHIYGFMFSNFVDIASAGYVNPKIQESGCPPPERDSQKPPTS